MAQELEEFEDPGLKAAVRRAWGAECCPFAIRRRIVDQVGGLGERRRRLIPLRPLFGLAAAALLLVAVGIVWHPWGPSRSTTPIDVTPAPSVAVLPVSLARDLTKRHDECSSLAEHADPSLAQDDPIELGRQMRERLNFPVLSMRLPRGWSFRGAAFCPVGAQVSAHLIYFRDGRPSMTVSVFSLPPSVWPGDHCPNCAQMAGGDHAVAGIRTKDGFYCLVGSADPPVSLSEVRGLLDDIWPQFAQDDDQAPGRVTIANNR